MTAFGPPVVARGGRSFDFAGYRVRLEARHGDERVPAVVATIVGALNAQVAAPDDHETPCGRDGADTGCTEVSDERSATTTPLSITNVLGHRDAEGSHLVALAERDAALAELADARVALAVFLGLRPRLLDGPNRDAFERAVSATYVHEAAGRG